jgi:uncharacterized protein
MMTPANENKPQATSDKCPICGKPAQPEFKPFCSKRCADVDLHRWLTGRYAVPAVEDDENQNEGDREA